MSAKRIMLFVLVSVFLSAAGALHAEETILDTTEDWSLQRVWKDAKGGRSHFYQGKLGLVCKSKQAVTGVRGQVRLLDVSGTLITQSKWIDFGSFKRGQARAKAFEIDKGIQFDELLLQVECTVQGKKKTLEFSTQSGRRPVARIALKENFNGIRIVSKSIDQENRGRGATRLTCRIRNYGDSVAQQPTANIEFQLANGKGKKTIKVLLDKGGIKPGETKLYKDVLIPGAPDFGGFSLGVSATWPESGFQVVEAPADSKGGDKSAPSTVESDELSVDNINVVPGENGKKNITFTVTNPGSEIGTNALKVEIEFADATGKALKTVRHTCAEKFPSKSTVNVTIKNQDVPKFSSFSVAIEF